MMLLTARQAQTAKSRPKAYGVPDGSGLTLWITPDDHRYWHFRYRMGGKQENNRASRLALIPRFRYSKLGSERQNTEPWSQMASIPAKSGETRNIATRWSKTTRSRLPPNTGTNI